MFLRWILIAVFAVVVARALRSLFGRSPVRPRRDRLDPDQAVQASWSEVSDPDQEGKGSGER